MLIPRWFFTLAAVLAFNWGVATWVAQQQFIANSEDLHAQISNESELLAGTQKLLQECEQTAEMLKTEYGARKELCNLGNDRHRAIQKKLTQLQDREKNLATDQAATQQQLLGFLFLISTFLFGMFLFVFTHRRYARRIRTI